jgi:hypothetical protein
MNELSLFSGCGGRVSPEDSMTTQTECIHYWVITPVPEQMGTCRKCKAKKQFPMVYDDQTHWLNIEGVNPNGGWEKTAAGEHKTWP